MANSAEVFFKSLTEIKLDDMRKSARLPVKVALVGSEDEIVWLQEHFRAGARDEGDLRRASDALRLFELPVDEEILKQINGCTFACLSPVASDQLLKQNLTVTAPLYTVGTEGEWTHFKRELMDARWDLHLAIGRNLPGIRAEVVEYLIVSAAVTNAEIAIASATVGKVPWLGPLFPGVAFADTFMLTKNQVMMLFRLAGAAGLPIDVVHRKSEIISTIANGLGWRALAREGVGLLPTPFAIALKGAVAYAGTYTFGRVISHFFVTGRRMEKAEERQLYKDSMTAGKEVASGIVKRFMDKIPRPARFRRPRPEH